MTVKAQIIELIDQVPDTELPIILEVVKHFVPTYFEDIATSDDLAAHDKAIREYMTGETKSHDDIDWDDIQEDEPLPDELEAINEANQEIARGEVHKFL